MSHRLLTLALTAAFLLAAVSRLSPFLAFDPDSSEYIVRARSLATLHGYRDVSRPDRMARSLRPPGVSLLLVPAAWISPYGVVAAKITILFCVLPLIELYRRFSLQTTGERATLAALALFLTSPFLLYYGLDALAEVPYAAVVLGAILILDRCTPTDRWRWPLAGLLAGLAPLTRTVGWAFALPVAVFLLVARPHRWRLAAAALVVLPGLLWAGRDRLTGESLSYESLAQAVRAVPGLSNLLETASSNAPYYSSTLATLELPVAWPSPALPSIGADWPPPRYPGTAALILGAALWLLAAIGLATEPNRPLRWLLAAYLICYLAVLLLYPFKTPRLLWPLTVLLLPYQLRALQHLPSLLRWLSDSVVTSTTRQQVSAPSATTPHSISPRPPSSGQKDQSTSPRPASSGESGKSISPRPASSGERGRGEGSGFTLASLAASLLVLALVLSQSIFSAQMSWTGAQYLLTPDRFYAEYETNSPPYFSDWSAAGRYLAQNTPAYARVLSAQHGLFCFSHRLEEHAHLSLYSAPMLLDHLANLRPQYLAVSETPDEPPNRLLASNPHYLFQPLYSRRGVTIYRIEPNLAGTFPPAPSLAPAIDRLRAQLERNPDSTALASRILDLLEFDRRYAETADLADRLIRDGNHSTELYLTLANALMELGRYDESRRWLSAAAHLPGADLVAEPIHGGLAILRRFETRDSASASKPQRIQAGLSIVRSHLASYRFDAALDACRKLLQIDPQNLDLLFWQATILERLGHPTEALANFRVAASAGHPAAQLQLLIAEWSRALEGSTPTTISYPSAAPLTTHRSPLTPPDSPLTTHSPSTTHSSSRRIDPNRPRDHIELADMLYKDRSPACALAVLLSAARRFPDNPRVLYLLAAAHESFGQYPQAESASLRATTLAPQDPTLHAQLHRIRQAMTPPEIP